jgi:hypothetical protein
MSPTLRALVRRDDRRYFAPHRRTGVPVLHAEQLWKQRALRREHASDAGERVARSLSKRCCISMQHFHASVVKTIESGACVPAEVSTPKGPGR